MSTLSRIAKRKTRTHMNTTTKCAILLCKYATRISLIVSPECQVALTANIEKPAKTRPAPAKPAVRYPELVIKKSANLPGALDANVTPAPSSVIATRARLPLSMYVMACSQVQLRHKQSGISFTWPNSC
jgi:hypothetical protein